MFVDGERTVIVHAGREEILFAYRSTGQSISRLFDAQLALGLLGGEFPASYGKLLQRILGETVAKGNSYRLAQATPFFGTARLRRARCAPICRNSTTHYQAS